MLGYIHTFNLYISNTSIYRPQIYPGESKKCMFLLLMVSYTLQYAQQ